MDPQTIVAASATTELVEVDSGWSSLKIESPVVRGVWTRDIEALCRALDAQQRAHGHKVDDAEEK
jgi:hypothetical protein